VVSKILAKGEGAEVGFGWRRASGSECKLTFKFVGENEAQGTEPRRGEIF